MPTNYCKGVIFWFLGGLPVGSERPLERFAECFEELVDPRGRSGDHDLTEMMFIALLATLCGAKHCTDIALFGREKEGLLRTILELKNGIPSAFSPRCSA